MLTLSSKDEDEGDECNSVDTSEGRGFPNERTKSWMSVDQAGVRMLQVINIEPTFRKPSSIFRTFHDHSTIENTLRYARS